MDNSACLFWQVCISILSILLSSIPWQEFYKTLCMDARTHTFLVFSWNNAEPQTVHGFKTCGFMIYIFLIIGFNYLFSCFTFQFICGLLSFPNRVSMLYIVPRYGLFLWCLYGLFLSVVLPFIKVCYASFTANGISGHRCAYGRRYLTDTLYILLFDFCKCFFTIEIWNKVVDSTWNSVVHIFR